MVMRQAQGEAWKATHWSGSVPVRVTGVRHSPVVTGQVHSDKAVLKPCWEFSPQVTALISGVHGQDRHSHDSAQGLGLSLSGPWVWMEASNEVIKVYLCTQGPDSIVCFSGVIFHRCRNDCREWFYTKGLAPVFQGWS